MRKNGMELSREFWEEIGEPAFRGAFPQEITEMAFGLVGEGSECLGFDDAISEDHDYGPGFCVWMPRALFERCGARAEEVYLGLPDTYGGYRVHKPMAGAPKRTGAFEIGQFYSQFIGSEQPPQSLRRWMLLSEERLSMAVDGEVFADPLGQFSAIRNALRGGFPEDVRRKKVAARMAVMAQTGQYNYARCMRRGDVVAASQAEAIFVRNTISLVGLLNRTYLPYYKWAYRQMRTLPILGAEVGELLEKLCEIGSQRAVWEHPHDKNWNPYVNREDAKVVLIEEICARVRRELKEQGLSELPDSFLEPHAHEVMRRIDDPEIRALHVLEG